MTEFKIKSILTDILFGSKICESANQRLIVDFFYDQLLLEKLLVGEPASVPELRKLLRKKILNFEFIKLDGEVRPAKGTTMMKYIPKSDHPKGIRPSSPKVATFFDLEKKAWRSVSQRSKEIVLKYAFSEKGEKKKPVFVVRDKGEEDEVKKKEEPTVDKEKDTIDITDTPSFSKPTSTGAPSPFVSPSADDYDDYDYDEPEKKEEEPIEEPEPKEEPKPEKKIKEPKVTKDDIEDIHPVRKPEVKIVEPDPTPKYGWKIKDQHKPKPEVRPIVRPSVENKPITPPPVKPDNETEVILPKPETSRHPFIKPNLPTKEPPLNIEPEDDEI